MKLFTPFRTVSSIGVIFRLAVLLLLPLFSISQTFIGVASSPADNGSAITTTVTVAPPAMNTGDLVIIYAHHRLTAGNLSITTTGGQSWHNETTASGTNQTFDIFWCRYNGSWAASPVVGGGDGTNPLTAVMYVFRPNTTTNSWGIHIGATNSSATGTAQSITGLVTTAARTVTMGFWGSPDDETWNTLTGAGWVKTGMGAYYRNTGGNDQSHTAAYAIRTTAGAVANVSQTQSASELTQKSIVSWYELAAPANDLCGGAIPLTSVATCTVPTAGTLVGASYTAIPTIGCGVIERSDVWYSFTAQSTNPTISLPAAPANARLQLFSGTCGALTSVACGNTSIAATGLTLGATYYIRVYSDPNFTGTAGAFTICVTDPVPANDLCGSAILLTSAGTCVNTAGTLAGSTYTVIPTLGCGVGTLNDVWYRFVAQTTNPTITLTTAMANPRLQLFSGTCGALISAACGNGSIAATGLTIGNTYYIRVYTNPNVYGFFNICVTDPAPANDLCGNAVALTSAATCASPTAGTLAGASYTTIPTIGCGVANRNDVWYSFTAQTTNPTITLTTGLANPRVQLFSGTCGALTSVACANGSLAATGLTIGNTYFVRIYADPDVNGTFTVCVVDPAPANDLCGSAIALTSSGTCVSTAGIITASTYTTIPTIGCGVATRNDVWYSFVAQTANPTVAITTAMANPRLQLFSGNCGALVSVACGNASIVAAGLTIGNTYFVRVYTDPNVNGTFTICVTDPAPANDLCGSAITLTSAATCASPTAGTLAGASYTTIPTIGCGVASRNDVWYSFTAQTTNPTITLATGLANPRVQLFSGTCGALTSVACANGSLAATGLTIGNTYFVRIYADPDVNGTFTVCVVDPAPANDLCANAILLATAGTCSNTQGLLTASTYTTIPTIGCGVTNRNDVWYRFVALVVNPTITISSAPANARLQLFSGTCAGLTSVACGNTSIVAAGLTIGNTYYVRVYTDPNTTGTFDICVVNPVPANDLCTDAIGITSASTCFNTLGTLTGATYTTIPTLGCGVGTRNDVWYTFTAQSVNPTITLSSAPANPRLQLFSGTCAALTSVACGNGAIAASGLTLGATYYIRVYTDPNVGGTFNICIVDPVPANDLCAGAILLTSSANCVTTTGTLSGATYTAVTTGCGLASRNDVWYRFVAQTNNPTITLSNTPANPQLQIFSGVCGSLAPVACGTTSIAATGLTIGNTYYVRVYTDPNVSGIFDICVTDPAPVNDLCSGAITLTSGTCVTTQGTLAGATYTTIPTIGCGVANRNDVWYTFVATATNPTITLSSAPANPRLQLFSGNCAALTSVACSSTGSIAATGLTIGDSYFVRVYTDPNVNGTFNICITAPAAANNLCGSSVLLTSSTTCITTAGTMFGSTLTATTIATPDCVTGATYDVWYRFVAQTTNPTVTLSNVGATFAGVAGLQLLSNSCGGTFTSLFCGTTSIAADFLTPGTTYLIRVYGTGALPTVANGFGFDICVTDQVTPAPSNDNCAGAINLPVSNSCSTNPGNMAGATASPVALGGTCTGPLAYDVWYRFVAANTTATVTIGSLGGNFTNSGIEILSGSCTSTLTSIACATGTTVNATGLTAGNTYFVRVYSRTAPPPNGNARFTICVTTTGLPVRFGNSYVNISKRTTGGVVQPGDTLEIRMTINHTSGTMYRLRYVDNVPTKTAMLTGATDRLRIITNEGLFYKQYTLGGGDDAGTYVAAPAASQYNVRMNLAFGTSTTAAPANNTATDTTGTRGQMTNSNRPVGGGGLLFATAFRVVVTGAVGDTITLNPGRFIYSTTFGSSDANVILTGTPFKILISQPLNLCTNSIGVNNAAEYGGTFGAGTTLNRSSDLTIPIAGYTFINEVNAYNGVGDGRYAIVKNISPRSGTVRTARRMNNCNAPTVLAYDDLNNCTNRMFNGFWFIDGDHSGTNNAAGNAPPSANTPGSYMLMVNADYVASEVFRQTINNLCPNTYYEFSAWVRNICPTCGIDSTGAQFAGTPTAPTVGYPGVYPNLSFSLNSVDYYNTGQIDTLGWLKKGFVFRTDANQTSATFSIRNNSQGGGGNDWVIDDIAVATCLPTMSYSPTINPNVCANNSISIADTISSYFRNYTTYKWQRSINGGLNWTDITPVTTLPDTNYYITSYTVPHTNTNVSDSGDLYRVVVATTPDNLVDPNCNISDGVTITLSVMDCGPVLGVNLLSFNGNLVDSKANLAWSTSREDSRVKYVVERSNDGVNFFAVGEVQAYYNGQEVNHYTFIDPTVVNDKAWYRIVIVTPEGKKKNSSIILLRNSVPEFEVSNIVNPIGSSLKFDISVTRSSTIFVDLIDMSGRTVLSGKQLVYAGTNSINFGNTRVLPAGVYTLRVVNKDKSVTKRLVKNN